MKSKKDLLDFLKIAVPAMVFKHLVKAHAVKVCSRISPAFAVVARHYGFDAYMVQSPGHYYNVVLTSGGPMAVDLSVVQFKLNRFCQMVAESDYDEEDDPFGEERVIDLAIEYISENPWRAVSVKPYRYSLQRLQEPDIDSESARWEIEGFPRTVKAVKKIIEAGVKERKESYFGSQIPGREHYG